MKALSPLAPHRTRGRRAALVAAAMGLTQCGDGAATQLLVRVSTTPAEALPIEAVEVEVQSEDGRDTWDRARFPIVGATGGRFTVPLTFGVAPRLDPSAGRFRVVARARLRGADGATLVTSALTSFLPGQRVVLPLQLDARCAREPACVAGQTCGALGCVSDAQPPTRLRILAPGESLSAEVTATCARPAEGCADRCDQGAPAPVARIFDPLTRQHTLSTTPDGSTCARCVLQSRAAFALNATPRPDLLPLYRCRQSEGLVLLTVQAHCELYRFNDGPVGYVVATATPGRCGTVPLYRLLNAETGDHYYTTLATERDRLVRDEGYTFEWIEAYVWPTASGT